MQIQPIGENLLLKPEKAQGKTSSGFVLPETQHGKLVITGRIEGIGRKCNKDFKSGQLVVYAQYSGYEMGGFVLINQNDVLGIVTDGD